MTAPAGALPVFPHCRCSECSPQERYPYFLTAPAVSALAGALPKFPHCRSSVRSSRSLSLRPLPFTPPSFPHCRSSARSSRSQQRAAEKLSHGLDDEPRDSRSSKLDERFLSGVNSKMSGGSCCFSVICIRRFPDPGNSLFLPALLTRRPLTSPTSWFRWSRAIPPCRVRDSSLAMTRTDK